jgi:hypothetical protein
MGLTRITSRFIMRMSVFNDKYQVTWIDDRSRAYEAAEWCDQTFGPEWGSFEWRNILRDGVTTNYFTFYRIDHTEWFMLKWNPNT